MFAKGSSSALKYLTIARRENMLHWRIVNYSAMVQARVHTRNSITVAYYHWSHHIYRKSLPSRPPARLFTIPPPRAELAYVDAWPNLSQREKAIVFVIVKIRAITISELVFEPKYTEVSNRELTNQTEPDHSHKSHDSQNSQTHPESRCHIQAQPEEALVGGCHGANIGV